jgi:WD40 repeat protein/Flp pilus assembly protein TadD
MWTETLKPVMYPYPGLRTFEAGEAEIFFGREEHVDDLLLRLQARRFLGIVGPSGCGKSSLVRAGLIPALHAGRVAGTGNGWQIAVMRPGTQPLKNLARALRDSVQSDGPRTDDGFLDVVLDRGSLGLIEALEEYGFAGDGNLLLLVDQFEELFRFTAKGVGSESRAFVDLLLTSALTEAAQRRCPIYVVVTMRSDFLGHCPVFRGLPEALNDSQYLTPRLNREQQRAAIEGPAAVFDGEIEPEVVNRILNEMGSDPDQLPLMQHLLMRMWRIERRKIRTEFQRIELTDETYRAVGGLRGCLSSHAQETFLNLQGQEPRIAEWVFRQLAEVSTDSRSGDAGRLVRKPCRYGTLSGHFNEQADRDALRNVVEAFRHPGRCFLMPPADEALTEDALIDISHESLIRQWETLKSWVQDEHKLTRVSRIVREKAARWKEEGERPNYLLDGVELAEARAWQDKYPDQVKEEEQNLILASIGQTEEKVRQEESLKYAQKLKEEEIRRREAERYSKLLGVRNRLLLGLALSALGLAVLAGYFLLAARSNAERADLNWQRVMVEAAKGREEAEQAAKEAKQKAEIKGRHDAMKQGLVRTYVANGVRQMDADNMERALVWLVEAFRLDSELSDNNDPGFRTREEVHRRRLAMVLRRCPRIVHMLWHDDAINHAEFSQDGKYIVTASNDGTAQIWDAPTGANLCILSHRQPQQPDRRISVRHAAFSPDGTYVVTAADDSTAVIWETKSGKPRHFLPHGDMVRRATFSPDGKHLVTASKDRKVRLWDVENGELCLPVLEHEGFVYSATFSPDSHRLVTASADQQGTVRIWNDKGDPISRPLRNPSSSLATGRYVLCASFSPKSDRLVTGDDHGEILIRNATTGEILSRAAGPDGRLVRVSFNFDGSRVLTVTASGTKLIPRLWDATTKPRAMPVLFPAKAYSESNPSFNVAGRYHAFFNPMDHAVQIRDEAVVKPRAQVLGAMNMPTFQHNSSRLAYTATDRTVHVVAFVDGIARSIQLKDCRDVDRAWLSPGGRHLLAVQKRQSTLAIRYAGIVGGAASRHGLGSVIAGLVPTAIEKVARLWDVDRGTLVTDLKCPGDVELVAFSQDGHVLVTVGSDNVVRTWDTVTGAAKDVFKYHTDSVRHAAFSPDGTRLVTSSQDFKACLWEIGKNSSYPSQVFQHRGWVVFGVFSPDGRKVLTASSDKTACLWDPISGKVFGILKHPNQVLEACFNGASSQVVTTCADMTARVWDVASGQASIPPLEHKDAVKHALFSSDALRVLTVTDKHARLWDSATGEPISPLLEQQDMFDAAFDTDEFAVITLGRDGTIQWWDAPRDAHGIQELGSLSRVISGNQLGDQGAWLVACSPNVIREDWKVIRQGAEEYSLPQKGELAWHHQEAQDAEKAADWKVALEHLGRIQELGERHASISLRRGIAFASLNKWENARAEYEIANSRASPPSRTQYKDAPNEPSVNKSDVAFRLARALSRLARFEEAQKESTKALGNDSRDGPIHLLRSLIHARQGNLPEAEREYEEGVKRSVLHIESLNYWWNSRPRPPQNPTWREPWKWIVEDTSAVIRPRPEKEQEAASSMPLETSDASQWVYYRTRALAHASLGEWADAAGDFAQAAVLLPNDRNGQSVWLGAARALLETQKWKEAEAACAKAIELEAKTTTQRKDWRSRFFLGIAHREQKQYEVAIEDYSQAIKGGATGWGIRVERGYAYSMAGNYRRAKKDYLDVLAFHEDGTIHNNLAVAYRSLGDYEQSVAHYSKAISRSPAVALYYRNRGNAYFDYGVYHLAAADYSKCLDIGGADARVYDGRGFALQRQGDRQKALDDYTTALRMDSSLAVAKIHRANLLLKKGGKQEAERLLREVVSTEERLTRNEPTVVSHEQELAFARESLAAMLQATGRLAEAAQVCRYALDGRRRVAEEKPEDPLSQRRLGLCCEKVGAILFEANERKSAKEHYEEGVGTLEGVAKRFARLADCQNSVAWLLVACPLAEVRDPPRAVEYASKAVKLAPGVGNFYNTLGVAMYRNGKWKEAIEALNESVQLTSDSRQSPEFTPDAQIVNWLFLAMAHKQLGDLVSARRSYDKAVQALDKDKVVIELDRRLFRQEAAALLGIVTETARVQSQAR